MTTQASKLTITITMKSRLKCKFDYSVRRKVAFEKSFLNCRCQASRID